MKNNKGFTLVELLATIAILAIVASITLYIAISVINQAKEKTYQVTLNNITSNANNYLLERGNDLVFVKTVDERLEYQCLMVKNLVDMGYLNNKVTEAKVADNKNVDTADYIYIERDASTKTIIKSVYVVDSDSTYAHVCGVASNIFGKIEFSSKPNANTWAREKDVLITYTIKNVNDVNTLGDYRYYYSFNDNSNNKVFNNYVMKENAHVETVGNITAKIVKNDKTIISKVYPISKIDRDGPKVKLNNNPTGYLYNSATISLNVSDIPVGTDGIQNSGVKYASFTKEDIEVTIGGTSITTFSLTKKDNNGNFDLVINDTTHSGNVNIRIKENTVFDNLDNGNKLIDLPLTAEWRKVAQIPTVTGYCSNPTYNGSSQTIVKDSGEGYTWTDGVTRTNAGSQDVTASLSSGYIWNDGTINDKKINCSISKKAITITAKDQTINYGGTISTGVGQVTAVTLATGDSLDSVTLTQSTTSATTSGTITPSAAIIKRDTSNVTSNYNITYSNGALTINKVAATLTCSDKTYNGSEQTACSCSGGTIGGTYKATNYSSSAYTASCTPDSNHTAPSNTTWTMGKKAITITAKDQTINYGETISTGVGQVTVATLASGDSLNSVTLTASTSNATTSGTITPSNATIKDGTTNVTSNYNITYNTGTLTINKVKAVITCDNKNYTGSAQTIASCSGGTVSGASQTNADDYTITCTGDSNHTNADSKTCKINKVKATITCDDKNYTGSAQTIASCSGGTVANASKTDAGDYKVTCTGDSNHTNADSKTCKINKVKATITCDNKNYTGSAQTIASCSGGTVANASQTNADDYKVTCTGDKNHTNADSKTCKINKVAATLTCSDKTYNGSEQTACSCSGGTIGGEYKATNYRSTEYSASCTPDKNHTAPSNETWTMSKKTLAITAWTTNFVADNTSYIRNDYATGVDDEKIELTYKPYTNKAGEYTYSTSAGSGKYTLSLSNDNYSISDAEKFTISGKMECWYSQDYGGDCYKNPNPTSQKMGSFTKDTYITIDNKETNSNRPDGCRYPYTRPDGKVVQVDICDKGHYTAEWFHVHTLNCWVWGGFFKRQGSEDPDTGACKLSPSGGKCPVGSYSDGKGNCIGGCFLAGTKIRTIYGFKNIDNIVVGDIVLSYNEKTGKNEYKPVEDVFIHKDKTEYLYSLTIDNKILKVTGVHRFYIKRNNKYLWISANELKISDMVRYANGTYHKITDISYSLETNTVYNFKVADNHNYYVTNDMILVHNQKMDDSCNSTGTCITP